MSRAECKNASVCETTGNIENSSDGHGYIGELYLDEETCINISLPEDIALSLNQSGKKLATIKGTPFPYPFGEDILFFKVNGRRVAFGTCSDYYVFVKSKKDIVFH